MSEIVVCCVWYDAQLLFNRPAVCRRKNYKTGNEILHGISLTRLCYRFYDMRCIAEVVTKYFKRLQQVLPQIFKMLHGAFVLRIRTLICFIRQA